METKDKLIIVGVLVLIVLNIVTLTLLTKDIDIYEDSEVTGAAIILSGELAQNSGLHRCCILPEGSGCYVMRESQCYACDAACAQG